MKFTREELCSIRLCHECYKNANEHPDEWSTMVCEAKHPVVWAKVATYPYWPAKLLEFDSDKAVVQFFGEKSRSTVSAHDCLKYTKDCPSIQIGQHKDALERAKMVSKMFERLRVFCTFRLLEHYLVHSKWFPLFGWHKG